MYRKSEKGKVSGQNCCKIIPHYLAHTIQQKTIHEENFIKLFETSSHLVSFYLKKDICKEEENPLTIINIHTHLYTHIHM